MKTLSLANLPALFGGRLERDVNRLMRQVVQDCNDRPGCVRARELVLTIKLNPELEKDSAVLDQLALDAVAKVKLPNIETPECKLIPDAQDRTVAHFHPESPDTPHQAHLSDLDDWRTDRRSGGGPDNPRDDP